MSELMAYKGLLLLAFFVSIFVLEHYRPWRKTQTSFKRYGRNLSFSIVNALLSPLLIISLTSMAITAIPSWRQGFLLSPWMIIMDIIILDLFLYYWHRATHAVPFLWRFHIIHHLDETLDSTSALRFHFGEIILAAIVRLVLLLVLSIPLETVIIFELLVFFAAVFHHSNVQLPENFEKIIKKIIVTPSIHWVHHHREVKYTNSRYGTIFSFWDKLFNTTDQFTRHSSIDIGVNHLHDKSFPQLLAAPFKREQPNV